MTTAVDVELPLYRKLEEDCEQYSLERYYAISEDLTLVTIDFKYCYLTDVSECRILRQDFRDRPTGDDFYLGKGMYEVVDVEEFNKALQQLIKVLLLMEA